MTRPPCGHGSILDECWDCHRHEINKLRGRIAILEEIEATQLVFIGDLRRTIEAMAERIHAQSELLSRRAEK